MNDTQTTEAGRNAVANALHASALPGLALQCLAYALETGAPFERHLPPYTDTDKEAMRNAMETIRKRHA